MTYEHRPGGYPASPDVDVGVPELCEKCSRDCPEPCEAFKQLESLKTWLIEAKAQGRISMSVGYSLGVRLGVDE